MKRITSLAFVLGFILLLSACSTTEIKKNQEEYQQLIDKLSSVEVERDALRSRVEELEKLPVKSIRVPSIMYSEYEQKQRLVLSEVDLHIYFGREAPVINKIMPNTVVKVLDAGIVEGNDTWLYVEIPVYDIPAHYKGWIRESDTVVLTEENKKLGYYCVTIKEGIEVYTCDSVEDIPKTKPEKTPYEVNVRIEKLTNGYAYVFAAGGWNFWVKEEYIIYAYDLPLK